MTTPEPFAAIDYAARQESDLLRAYQLVGIFYLLMAISGGIGVALYTAAGVRMGSGFTMGLPYAIQVGPTVLAGIGAAGMIARRRWGAPIVAAFSGLRLLIAGGSILHYGSLQSATSYFSTASAVVTAMQALIFAFLPMALWQLCRRKGEFAR